MNKKILHLLPILILGLVSSAAIQSTAQTCSGNAPGSYTVIPNPYNSAKCYLMINWGDAMPEILCGDPGTPAPGSTVPEGRRIEFLYATINGTQYTLYSRFDCPAGTNMLHYGPEANTYITGFDEIDFCLADAEHGITVEGVQLGAEDFNCFLLNSQTAAPIELAYFKAQTNERTNVLQWATASEENTAVFVVEKKTDGQREPVTVGTRPAQGFSSSMEYYQLEDANPRPLTYYRLRAIDFDGSEMNSEWIAVKRAGKNGKTLLEVAPVPLGNEPLQVYYEAKTDETILVSISDVNGRLLWEERKELEAGTYNWQLEFPDFQQQLLIFRLESRDGVSSRLIPCEKGF